MKLKLVSGNSAGTVTSYYVCTYVQIEIGLSKKTEFIIIGRKVFVSKAITVCSRLVLKVLRYLDRLLYSEHNTSHHHIVRCGLAACLGV